MVKTIIENQNVYVNQNPFYGPKVAYGAPDVDFGFGIVLGEDYRRHGRPHWGGPRFTPLDVFGFPPGCEPRGFRRYECLPPPMPFFEHHRPRFEFPPRHGRDHYRDRDRDGFFLGISDRGFALGIEESF